MTEPALPAGETRPPSGNPWASVDPDAAWWSSDTETHTVIAPPSHTTEPESPDGGDHSSGDAADAPVGEAPDTTDRLWPDLDAPDLIVDDPPALGAQPAPITDTSTPDTPAPVAEPVATPIAAATAGVGAAGVGVTVPGQQTPGRDGPAGSTVARGARGRSAHTQALLETSPFWLGDTETERASERPTPDPSLPASRLGVPPRRRPRTPRKPAFALAALVVLALVGAFFAWVSAEPLWLALGHGEQGTATVTRCSGGGVARRCIGQFTATDTRLSVPGVTLLGVDPDQRAAGAVVHALMVSPHSRQAFVGEDGVMPHLRWMIGLLLVLLSGLGIAAMTGARRLETLRARRTAMLLSLAGPLALLAGFLALTY